MFARCVVSDSDHPPGPARLKAADRGAWAMNGGTLQSPRAIGLSESQSGSPAPGASTPAWQRFESTHQIGAWPGSAPAATE